MIHFDLPKQKSSIIKVLGVGGGGSNAVNFMFDQQIEGVDFVICNTDAKAIEQSKVPNKVQLGPHLTQGLGAGANPEIGKLATEESLEEIRRILELNTKMAFITVGMGGGTGTGGAPIIAQICKDLGILTVGIVTTPFSFEGPRRHQQAQEGIRQLKPLVDTLLVISKDKLRDVCTVMKNGGVAILGKAEVGGENRAQLAIEQALASPLLNDNDILGAKWILININSAEGEFECTLDEMDIINNHLRQQAGPNTDVIVGMGYDEQLGDKIGITLVATGFQHKDPFQSTTEAVTKKEETDKIILVLNEEQPQIVAQTQVLAPVVEMYEPVNLQVTQEEVPPPMIVRVNEIPEEMDFNIDLDVYPFIEACMREEETEQPLHFELSPEITSPVEVPVIAKKEEMDPLLNFTVNHGQPSLPTEILLGGLLSKPQRIYEEPETEQQPSEVAAHFSVPEPAPTPVPQTMAEITLPEVTVTEVTVAETPVADLSKSEMSVSEMSIAEMTIAATPIAETPQVVAVLQESQEEIQDELNLQFVVREEPAQTSMQPVMSAPVLEDMHFNEAEEQKRKAAERLQKLRNLSFNLNNPADPNNEFDVVPAYVRKNMEMFGNTLTSVEQFYSKITVGKDENDQPRLSTRNTFLEGKKPD
jgi:cell division protein FtsZ